MVLPRWLRSRTQPVAVEDVIAALTAGLAISLSVSASFDVPGPETLEGRTMLEMTAQALHLKKPIAIEVPLLSPWLSSHWVRLVTRADWTVARELVLGLTSDIVARDATYWTLIDHPHLATFRIAADRALAEERDSDEYSPTSTTGRAVEQLVSTTRHA